MHFLEAKPDVKWARTGAIVRGAIEGVEIGCDSRWWGTKWKVTAESAFPVPEKLIVYISERGMDHGFWRDLPVGDDVFDRRFFVFCDVPALLPLVVGPATRRALSETGPNRDDIILYVRDGRVQTMGTNARDDLGAIDRHLAVHRALAADHRGCLEGWKARMVEAAGRADATWPPTATLLRPSGALLVNMTWTAPTTRDGHDWDEAADSLRTAVTAHDDRARMKWVLREVGMTVPCTHVLADRRFVLVGKLPFALPVLETIIKQAQLASIAVTGDRITVSLRGLATARQIEGAVRIIGLVVQALIESTSPYR